MADMLDEIIAKNAEIDRLRAELAEARRALLAGNDTVLANKKLQEDNAAKDARIAELEAAGNRLGDAAVEGALTSIETVTELAEAKARIAHERVEGDKISAALEMANVRVAELDAHMANEYARCEAWKARAERAEARIAELEATRLHWTGEVARLTQDSCDDQDRAERAEAERDVMRALLRPALDFICAHGDCEDEGDQDLANRIGAALAPSPCRREVMSDDIGKLADEVIGRMKVHNGTVADIPDAELLRRAVTNARCAGPTPHYRWVAVMAAFALGSTYAANLCRRFDLDPDELVRR